MTKLRSIRLDDEVWGEVLKFRKVYGTDNAAMRAIFKLAGSRLDKVFVPDLAKEEHYEVKPIQTWRAGRKPLLKPSQK